MSSTTTPPLPTITLYLAPTSSSLFPHILLRHTSLPFTPILLKPAQLTSLHFLTHINPKGQVPVLHLSYPSTSTQPQTQDQNQNQKPLETRDYYITENPAIAYAIHLLSPETHLFGTGPIEAMRVMEFLSWIASAIHAQAWGPFVRAFRFTESSDPEVLEGIKKRGREKVLGLFDVLEAKLKDKEEGKGEGGGDGDGAGDAKGGWAVGQGFSAVDAYLYLWWGLVQRWMGDEEGLEGRYPRWKALAERVAEVQAVQEAVEFERRAVEGKGEEDFRWFADEEGVVLEGGS